MLAAVLIVLEILLYFCLASLVAGFIRPVYALWFLDRSNRLKVLTIYGGASIIILIMIQLMRFIR